MVGRRLLERIITMDDYEPLSTGRLPKDVYDFIAGSGQRVDAARGSFGLRRSGWRPPSERSPLGPSALGTACRPEASWSASSAVLDSRIRP
jgi:hypothetical protein